jgi:hypothetical protein
MGLVVYFYISKVHNTALTQRMTAQHVVIRQRPVPWLSKHLELPASVCFTESRKDITCTSMYKNMLDCP